MEIRFGVQSAEHRSRPVSAQRMLNCYLEQAPAGAKSTVAVVPAHGVAAFATPGAGPLRGACVVNDAVYVVSGTELYSVDSLGVATLLGTVPNLDAVDMVGDGSNVVIVTQNDGYVWNGSTLAQITDEDFPGAEWIEYVDGYVVVGEPLSGRFAIAGPLTPTSWDGLDFATAEGSPDDLLYGVIEKREILLFGRDSLEVWANTGNADFPFERVGFVERGIRCKRAAAKANNTVCFVGDDNIVYRLNGYTPERISTHTVEQALEGTTEAVKCLAWAEGGHQMFSVQCSAFCYVYDFATSLWHERGSYGETTWEVLFTLSAFGGTLVGQDGTNKIGQLTADTFTQWGDRMVSLCTSAAVADGAQLIAHNSLELQFEAGVGTVDTADPQVMLQFSDDGGRSWSSEKWRSLGAVGEHKHRCRWHRLGSSRDRVYRYAISDPVRRTLVGARLNEF